MSQITATKVEQEEERAAQWLRKRPSGGSKNLDQPKSETSNDCADPASGSLRGEAPGSPAQCDEVALRQKEKPKASPAVTGM